MQQIMNLGNEEVVADNLIPVNINVIIKNHDEKMKEI